MAEPLLKKGSTGPAVRDLQDALQALGYQPGAVDGIFGAQTEAAVKAFQSARHLAVDGVVGPITWTNIDEADQSEPVLKRGATGLPVRRVQKRLSFFYTVDVDGRFGPNTEATVKALQHDRNLVVDGVVGPKTWAVIDSLEIENAPA